MRRTVQKRLRLSASVFFAALLVSPAALAEPGDLERARTLFDEAGELERQGQWQPAQEHLRAALRIRETPHLRYALGWALENGDRLIEARTEYEVALRLARRGNVEEVSRLAATRIAEVDRKIPILQLRVHGMLARDTHVLVDGQELVVHGDVGTMAVDPGPRTLRVERSGQSPTSQVVTVSAGAYRVIDVEGDTNAGAGIGTNTAEAESRTRVVDRNRTVPWVLVGSGGALALGGLLVVLSSSADATTRDESSQKWCDATACVGGKTATRPETADAAAFRREAYDAASRGNTKQVVGAILGGVGVASIAVGTYMLVRGDARQEPTRAARTRTFDAAPLPGGGVASATLTF